MWVFWLPLHSLWYFLPQWVLLCEFLLFSVWCNILISRRFIFCLLVCICEGWNLLCQYLYVLYPWDRRPSSLQIEFVHTFSSNFTRSLYTKKKLSHNGCHLLLFPLSLYLLGVQCENCSLSLCEVSIFYLFHRNILGEFLNVVTWLTILVLEVFDFFLLLVSHRALLVVYPPWLWKFSFLTFYFFLGETAEILFGLVFYFFCCWVCMLELLWVLLINWCPQKWCMGDWKI